MKVSSGGTTRHSSRCAIRPRVNHGVRQTEIMTILREYDIVRVARLNDPVRKFDGTDGVCRPPMIGDVATICHEYDPKNPNAPVVVEMVDNEGLTIWLADFHRTELELVERPK
jgi:hypothetical protein